MNWTWSPLKRTEENAIRRQLRHWWDSWRLFLQVGPAFLCLWFPWERTCYVGLDFDRRFGMYFVGFWFGHVGIKSNRYRWVEFWFENPFALKRPWRKLFGTSPSSSTFFEVSTSGVRVLSPNFFVDRHIDIKPVQVAAALLGILILLGGLP